MRQNRIIAILIAILVGIVLLTAGAMVYVRLAPLEFSQWHVDPMTASSDGRSSSYRVVPEGSDTPEFDAIAAEYPVSAARLKDLFDGVLLSQPRTRVLHGESGDLLISYVQRSRIMGFPDIVSVRFVPLGEDRSTLAVYSRSRFGESDFGVNRQRVLGVLEALQKAVDAQGPG